MLDEQMDGEAQHRKKLQAVETELADVHRRLSRVWNLVETTDLDPSEATSRIRGTGSVRRGWSWWPTRRAVSCPSGAC